VVQVQRRGPLGRYHEKRGDVFGPAGKALARSRLGAYNRNGSPDTMDSVSQVVIDGSLLHILFNMLTMFDCGRYLSPLLVRSRLLGAFLIGGTSGSLPYLATGPVLSVLNG
jgi:hypothetical protein